MPRALRCVSALVGIVVAMMGFVAPAGAVMPAPTWTAGDYWVYAASSPGLPAPGTMRLDVIGSEIVTIGGVPYPSYRVAVDERFVYPPPMAGWMNATGVQWYRASDYALVAQYANMTIEIPPTVSMTLNGTMTYDPPKSIQWPLTSGNAWMSSGWENTSTSVNGGPPTWANVFVTASLRVEPERPVTVPAGTFPTTPLNATTADYANVTYWSPVAGNGVLLVTYDATGAEMQRAELTAYRYQAGGGANLPPNVALTSPVGGEDWTGGSMHTIAYVTADPDNGTLDVRIDFSSDGGGTWIPFGTAPGEPTGPHAYVWTVPLVDTTTARIRVCASDRVNPEVCAASGNFAVDSTRPGLVGTDPMGGTAGVPVGTPVTITFSEAMDHTSTEAAVGIVPAVGGITYAWPDPATLVVRHSDFAPCTTYTVSVAAGARDASDPGNFLSGAGPVPNPWSFTTACGLYIVRTDPYDGEANVELTRPIVVEFSGPVDVASMTISINPPLSPLMVMWSPANTVLTISHPAFQPCTLYTVQIAANGLVPGPVPNPWSFTTACDPRILVTSPVDGAINVSLPAPILVNFSVPMDPASLRWTVVPDPGLAASWSPGDMNLTLSHATPFASMTMYTVQIWANDTAGRALVPGPVPNPWSFATAGCAPYIVTTSPRDGEGEVPLDAPLNLTFCRPMDPSTVTVTLAPPVANLTFTWFGGDTAVTVDHDPYLPCTLYSVTVTGRDTSGASLVPGPVPNPWTFETVCAPTVAVTTPAGGEVWSAGSRHDVAFTMTDTETPLMMWINLSTDGGATFPTVLQGGMHPTGAARVPVTLPALATDEPDARIRVTARDSTGLEGSATSPAFTIDGTAPTVTGSDPADGATGVSRTAPFTIVFSERMDPATTEPSTILAPDFLTLSFTWSGDGRTATIGHAPLRAGVRYNLSVGTTALDASDPGNRLALFSANFTTAAPDTTPPAIAHTPPGAVYVGDTIRIDATVADADSGVDEVRLVYTPVGGTEQNVTMTLSGGVWSYAIPAQSAAGTVRYHIYATDHAENGAVTQEYTVAVRERTQAPSDLWWIALILVAVVAALAVALMLWRRRKKKPERETPRADPPTS